MKIWITPTPTPGKEPQSSKVLAEGKGDTEYVVGKGR